MDFKKTKVPLSFLVYIVESPSPVDLYHKRSEAELLTHALQLAGVPSVSRLAVNLEAFIAAFTIGIEDYLKDPTALPPFIHISAHGNKDGIVLTDGQVVKWSSLKEMLVPINKSLGGYLLLCLSSCEGWNACSMAMTESDIPFIAMVSNLFQPTWSETAIGFSSFYHLLSQGFYIYECVEGMRYASGNESFVVEYGDNMQELYLDKLNKIKQQQMLESLHKHLPEINSK